MAELESVLTTNEFFATNAFSDKVSSLTSASASYRFLISIAELDIVVSSGNKFVTYVLTSKIFFDSCEKNFTRIMVQKNVKHRKNMMVKAGKNQM